MVPKDKNVKRSVRKLFSIKDNARASVQETEQRKSLVPKITYPEQLPITAHRSKIVRAIKENQVVIISGETGCGKSTQIPKMCLEAGRGIKGVVGCTQPRRIAATTIARRIARELGEEIGRSVGYKIRFRDKTSRECYIKIMTDGILLAETQADRGLYSYDTLIIDEAHERTLNIDFLLGILRKLLPNRKELKLIISSATLDTEKFREAFPWAPVLEVGGKMYPVEVEYLPNDPRLEEEGESTYVDIAVKSVDILKEQRGAGDILVFMPTEQDILETCERLQGRNFPDTAVLPFFARLPASEQERIYSKTGPKIVVATNVAETSLTIPGIKYVIDTGLARILEYLPRTRTTSLPVKPISQSSAEQRKGRCGRTQDGVCIRLYSREDYESRPAFTSPEILRSNLAEVILRMISLNLGDPSAFPFLDRPSTRRIKDGFDLLLELGAIKKKGPNYTLTDIGRLMARMPLDPRISRIIVEAKKEECVKEAAVIASALSIQDPRERPAEKADQADQMHAPFKDNDSDFITLLNIWNRYHREWESLKTQNKMRKFCKANFLSFNRMREWVYTYEQITGILREHRIPLRPAGSQGKKEAPLYDRIHRSILSGFLSNICTKKEKNLYQGTRGREIMIFPGSSLFNKAPSWIVAAEIVRTSRLFARTVAKIDPKWLETLGADLCKSSYYDPHWEKNRGEVQAFEKVTLFGLPIVTGRKVRYAPINQKEAHKIFVQSALVESNIKGSFSFLEHNMKLLKEVSRIEDKLRRRDMLVGQDVIADFYSKNLRGVCDTNALKKAIAEKGNDRFLRLKEEQILVREPMREELEMFPDMVRIGKRDYKVSYKFAPGEEQDGPTLQVPLGLLSEISAEQLEWILPGLVREKITALIKGLPKRYRKKLVPVNNTVEVIVKEMRQENRPLLSSLSEFIHQEFGVDIPASVLKEVNIPEHLKIRISVIDSTGKEIHGGRDLRSLVELLSAKSANRDSLAWRRAREKWERTHITSWDFGPLPERISFGSRLVAYPALQQREGGIRVELFQARDEALKSHREGVQALLRLHLAKDIKFLKRSITLPEGAEQYSSYFGGAKVIENAILERLLKEIFQKNIRTPEAFHAYADSVRVDMFEKGKELRDHVITIAEEYWRTAMRLQSTEASNKSNSAVLDLCNALQKELDSLVPQNFLDFYPVERLPHLPRYLKAIRIRAERGSNDPAKDSAKMNRARPFVQAFDKMLASLTRHSSTEKRLAIEDFRWALEEFKVSLFAQNLKTAFPVSEKRLEKRIEEIKRMA